MAGLQGQVGRTGRAAFIRAPGCTVHVLDLAYVLPLLLATGVLLFRHHLAAPCWPPCCWSRLVTLGLALLFVVGFVDADTDSADIGEAVIWAAITVVSAAWLSIVLRRLSDPSVPWLRARAWP